MLSVLEWNENVDRSPPPPLLRAVRSRAVHNMQVIVCKTEYKINGYLFLSCIDSERGYRTKWSKAMNQHLVTTYKKKKTFQFRELILRRAEQLRRDTRVSTKIASKYGHLVT